MITKKTVLILGAGASMDYEFPSGRQLLEEIKKGISGVFVKYAAGYGLQ